MNLAILDPSQRETTKTLGCCSTHIFLQPAEDTYIIFWPSMILNGGK